MDDVQFLKNVCERDIDLLLLEELHVSQAFREWLLREAFGADVHCRQFLGAWHSISAHNLGESDLIVRFIDGQGTTVGLLLENKIDAPQQPDQALRYERRGDEGIRSGHWEIYRTCIVAPDAYLVGRLDGDEYHAHLSYESLQAWFLASSDETGRAKYKASVVQAGIEQGRRGYTPVPHEQVTKFWQGYVKLARAEFPSLGFQDQGQTPSRHSWGIFRGPYRLIYHKVNDSVVDLQVPAGAKALGEIIALNQHLLTEGIDVVARGKSAFFRVTVPQVSRFEPAEPQYASIRTGLEAVAKMKALDLQIVLPAQITS